jgi:transcription-repair coupling factor (superfamily II helicase)
MDLNARQVYFLHNEVDTIQNRLQKLEEILPEELS